MPRRRAPNAPCPSDLGPMIRGSNGKPAPHVRLEVLDAADPDNPNRTIRRAMVAPHYDRLHRKGILTDEQREACDAYAILTERRDGARWVNGERIGGSQAPAYRGHPTLTQVQASARLTTAHGALGGDASALLLLFVVEDMPMDAIAQRRHERPEVTKGRILAAITRLAEHWGC